LRLLKTGLGSVWQVTGRGETTRAGTLAEARRLGKGAKRQRDAAQRQLLVEGMAKAAADKGHEAVRVDDVLAASGLSRSTFYRHFDGKDECFEAAFEWVAAGTFALAEEALAASPPEPTARVEEVLRATLRGLTSKPGVAQLVLVEVRATGSVGREAQLRWFERFAELLDSAAEGRGDPIVARLTVGALSALLSGELAESGESGLVEILPQLMYVALAPYVGPGAASERSRRVVRRS